MKAITEGTLLWEPSHKQIETSGISKFMKWLKQEKGVSFANQKELWVWSVDKLELFWESIWEYCKVESKTPYREVLQERVMPGAKWFTGATLNYSEHVFRNSRKNKPALIFQSETTSKIEVSWQELEEKTAIVDELREVNKLPLNMIILSRNGNIDHVCGNSMQSRLAQG